MIVYYKSKSKSENKKNDSKFKYFLKVNNNYTVYKKRMNTNFHLTINELPKTKKMQVDERHPLLKIQQNVIVYNKCIEIYIRWIRKG